MLSSTATTFQRLKSLSCYGLIASSLPLAAATELARAYSHGQPMPVTCLNRTIDSGEHVLYPYLEPNSFCLSNISSR
jgi:hypothetical protein